MRLFGSSHYAGRRLSPIIIISCFIVVTPPMCRAVGAEPFSFGARSISVGIGLLSHSVPSLATADDLQHDLTLSLGISSPVGRRSMWGITGVISTPTEDVGEVSLVAAKIGLRFYPLFDRLRRDQFYLKFGGILLAGGGTHDFHYGVGVDLGLGVDVFVAQKTTTFLEAGFAFVGISDWRTHSSRADFTLPLTASAIRGIETPLRVLFQVTLGARVGI